MPTHHTDHDLLTGVQAHMQEDAPWRQVGGPAAHVLVLADLARLQWTLADALGQPPEQAWELIASVLADSYLAVDPPDDDGPPSPP